MHNQQTSGRFNATSNRSTSTGQVVTYRLSHGNHSSPYHQGNYSNQFGSSRLSHSGFQATDMSYSGGSYTGFRTAGWGSIIQPALDISETSSDVVLTAHIPDVEISDINLGVSDNSVTITASTWNGHQSAVINRTVALPTSIRPDSVDANLQSGVLEIRCPKVDSGSRRREQTNN